VANHDDHDRGIFVSADPTFLIDEQHRFF